MTLTTPAVAAAMPPVSGPTPAAAVSTLDVWDRFGAQLRAFIGRRVADPDDADDVLQDVFLRLHARIDTLRDGERLAPWVYRITRNAVTDHYRARGQAARLVEGRGDDLLSLLDAPAELDAPGDLGHAVGGFGASSLAVAEDDADDPRDPVAVVGRYVAGLVDGLPEHYRQAVQLAEIEGLTQQEISERLGLSLSGAKSRVQRGRALLRARLLECCHVELDRRGGVIDYRPRETCCPLCGC